MSLKVPDLEMLSVYSMYSMYSVVWRNCPLFRIVCILLHIITVLYRLATSQSPCQVCAKLYGLCPQTIQLYRDQVISIAE